MADLSLTPAQWLDIRSREVARALQLTRSVEKANELAQAAITDALDPDEHPWDPIVHPNPADFICDLVWSRYGNEITSYRATLASESLSAADDEPIPSSQDPLHHAMKAEDQARAERRYAALRKRVAGDALIELLLEDDDDEEDEDASSPNAEAATTRRALAKGYTEKEIKNARLRLRRYGDVVAQEDEATER